jgi:hypothetical protein
MSLALPKHKQRQLFDSKKTQGICGVASWCGGLKQQAADSPGTVAISQALSILSHSYTQAGHKMVVCMKV